MTWEPRRYEVDFLTINPEIFTICPSKETLWSLTSSLTLMFPTFSSSLFPNLSSHLGRTTVSGQWAKIGVMNHGRLLCTTDVCGLCVMGSYPHCGYWSSRSRSLWLQSFVSSYGQLWHNQRFWSWNNRARIFASCPMGRCVGDSQHRSEFMGRGQWHTLLHKLGICSFYLSFDFPLFLSLLAVCLLSHKCWSYLLFLLF